MSPGSQATGDITHKPDRRLPQGPQLPSQLHTVHRVSLPFDQFQTMLLSDLPMVEHDDGTAGGQTQIPNCCTSNATIITPPMPCYLTMCDMS